MQCSSSCCDFCGNAADLQQYPTVHGSVTWYACAECARIIATESWEQLIERSLAAYRDIRPITEGEEPILRNHVEQLVQAFRSFRPELRRNVSERRVLGARL
ncbi:MAG: hypothetical protein JO249_19795 [Acidobacteria bacterium]|nr:hypothetical protein [Acidobacteriota bacterium]